MGKERQLLGPALRPVLCVFWPVLWRLQSTLADAEASYRQLYEYHVPLLRFLKESGIPAPKALYTAAEFVLNTSLRRIFEEEELDVEGAENLLEEARLEAISLPLR